MGSVYLVAGQDRREVECGSYTHIASSKCQQCLPVDQKWPGTKCDRCISEGLLYSGNSMRVSMQLLQKLKDRKQRIAIHSRELEKISERERGWLENPVWRAALERDIQQMNISEASFWLRLKGISKAID